LLLTKEEEHQYAHLLLGQCSNSLQGDFVGPAKVKSVHQTSTPIMHTCGINKRERERENRALDTCTSVLNIACIICFS